MVTINGKEEAVDGQCVYQYLVENGYQMDTVAVECNEEIVPKKSYQDAILRDGDRVEVVSFVGGG